MGRQHHLLCLSLALVLASTTSDVLAQVDGSRSRWVTPRDHIQATHAPGRRQSATLAEQHPPHTERFPLDVRLDSAGPLAGSDSGVPDLDDRASAGAVTLARPVIVKAARVHGPVSPAVQAQLEAEEQLASGGNTGRSHYGVASEALRSLLHGSHKPRKFKGCPRCRIVRCRNRFCSGHCRKNRQLHVCDDFTNGSPEAEEVDPEEPYPPAPSPGGGATCPEDPRSLEDVQGKPPSAIGEVDTVVVTAPAPFIGCADIRNRPSGCPARGTRATLPGRRAVTVIASFCRAEYYAPECGSPILPAGVCECTYRDAQRPPGSGTGGRPFGIVRAACSTAELEAGSGVGEADGSPSEEGIAVRPSGGVTQTWFSDFLDPQQRPEFSFQVNATVRGMEVETTIDIYPGRIEEGAYVEYFSDYIISSDYDYEDV